ncbi:MAG: hypothetical protein RIB64_23390 [Arenibacter algicola]
MEKSEIWIQIFKYASIIVTTAAGIIGLIMDPRDTKGNLTYPGKILLLTIVVSTIIGIITQYTEFSQDKKKMKLTLENERETNRRSSLIIEQNSKVLENVLRSVNPIDEFTVFFDIHYPMNEKFAKGYSERISSLRLNLKNTKVGENNPYINSGFISGGGKSQYYWKARYNGNSIFFPQETEQLVKSTFTNINLRFRIVKDSLVKEKIIANQSDLNSYELMTNIKTNIVRDLKDGYKINEHSHLLNIYTDENGVRLSSTGFNETNLNDWLNPGNITSIVDLLGSFMIITSGGTFHPNQVSKGDARQMAFNFRVLKIKVARGRILNIDKMETIILKNSGYVIHVFQFPKTLAELEKLMDKNHSF